MQVEIKIKGNNWKDVCAKMLGLIEESLTYNPPPGCEPPDQEVRSVPEVSVLHADSESSVPNEGKDPELDSAGYPWNGAIHVSTKAKLKSGRWRYKPGVSKDMIQEIENESDPYPQESPPTSPPQVFEASQESSPTSPSPVFGGLQGTSRLNTSLPPGDLVQFQAYAEKIVAQGAATMPEISQMLISKGIHNITTLSQPQFVELATELKGVCGVDF